ncbi:MAG: preprotein translocase subunit SecG [Clostridia bacterium]|nr:preprotein translocase subunit SecG [Clostridia bacterium]
MEIARYVVMGILAVVCVILIVLVMMQSKEDQGASGTVMGASAQNFYEKNKGRTREGKMKRATVILIALVFVLVIALNVLYVA